MQITLKRYVTAVLVGVMVLIFLITCRDSEIGSTGDDPGAAPILPAYSWNPNDFDTVYDVGPGKSYETPSHVPWEDLDKSTLVRIFYRAEPYRHKWVITTTATADAPLVVTGVPENGKLPVITGEDAETRRSMIYLNQVRSVIKIGNYTSASDTDNPAHVYLENLDIRSGREGYFFTDMEGKRTQYSKNAAAVHVEDGIHITLRGLKLHDCGNGIMSTYITKNLLIRGNHIYDNGIEDRYYEHNTYTESQGIIYEYNYFGPLRAGCNGNNLKDRSSGTIIRYNYIEGGNRQLDLVDSHHTELNTSDAYNETFVYGNIFIEPDNAGNSQIIHYGGDSSNEPDYRRGTLYLYHNTIISRRNSNTTLIRLSTHDVSVNIRNNIIYTTASPGHLAMTTGKGRVTLLNNWIKADYRDTFESSSPDLFLENGNITGIDPGFINVSENNFKPAPDSSCIDAAIYAAPDTSDYPVSYEYEMHFKAKDRMVAGESSDVGAFEAETQ